MSTAIAVAYKTMKAREYANTLSADKSTTTQRIHAAHGLIELYAPELVKSLPAGVNGARLVDYAKQHLREKPDLLECTPDSLMASISRAMLGGFELGGPRADAYIVPFNTKLKLPGGKEVWRKLATCIESWRGLVKLVDNTGRMTRQPVVQAIYDGESWQLTTRDYLPAVEHRIDSENTGRKSDEDSKIVACYAVFWVDNETRVHLMQRAEIDAIRDKHSKSKQTWESHYREMAYKTVIRQMIARGMLPVSNDQAEKMRRAQAVEAIEQAAETSQVIDAQTWSVLSDDAPAIESTPEKVETTSDSDGQMGDRP